MTYGRPPAPTRRSSGSAAAKAPRARRPAAVPRAPRLATRCRSGSRAARCRCSGGCLSSGFSNALFKTEYQVVNLGRLAELFPAGSEVTPETLVAGGAVRKGELVKVLG